MIARMWEVKAQPDATFELLEWVRQSALPKLRSYGGFVSAELYSSLDDRIVLIVKWDSQPQAVPAAPTDLVTRDPHSWDFHPVDLS